MSADATVAPTTQSANRTCGPAPTAVPMACRTVSAQPVVITKAFRF